MRLRNGPAETDPEGMIAFGRNQPSCVLCLLDLEISNFLI
jgi:hypothetical protein